MWEWNVYVKEFLGMNQGQQSVNHAFTNMKTIQEAWHSSHSDSSMIFTLKFVAFLSTYSLS